MKREFLKGLNLADDLIDQIMAEHGKSATKSKEDLDTANTMVATLKKQAEETAKTIEGFKGLDIEGVKKAASD